MAHETNSADLGLFIRDMIEGHEFATHDFTGEEIAAVGADEVISVDVSDLDNPIIYTASGARFVVRIFKEGAPS